MLMAKVKIELIGCGRLFTNFFLKRLLILIYNRGLCEIIGRGLPIKLIPAEVF